MDAPIHEPVTPFRPSVRRFGARDALVAVAVAVVLLLLIEGASIRESGERMDPGVKRTAVLAIGHPAGWLADRLPLADAADSVTSWLSPDEEVDGPGGFDTPAPATAGGVPPVAPESFDPVTLGDKAPRLPPLGDLLVTGDSLAQPLDVELARRLAGDGVEVDREVHLGTGVSKSDLLDWGALSVKQARERPDAVVVFIGANEGFPIPAAGGEVECCGPAWAAAYAFRVRRMMNAYRRRGATRVYWLTLPATRDGDLRDIARTVNAGIRVAAQPYRAHVRVLEMADLFTPGFRYRDAMQVGGRGTIVREPDGIHLNDAGARVAADAVLAAIRRDFEP